MIYNEHHLDGAYLSDYRSRVAHDIVRARSGDAALRRAAARLLMRLGAWLRPDKATMVVGDVVVIDRTCAKERYEIAA